MDMIDTPPTTTAVVSDKILGFRPLYRQVRDTLVKRIADGVWQAGQPLPSEPELAAELSVSQGTVRKALDAMTAEKLVIRRQGRGTFVAQHDDARILFKFFKLVPDQGDRGLPDSKLLHIATGADPVAAKLLEIDSREPVVVIDRLRSVARTACVLERICVQAAAFPGLHERDIPDNLYDLYAREFGITIGRASERLKAVAATARQAEHLDVDVGHPLLQIDRIAYSLDARRVEWRVSLCRTDLVHYASDVR